MFILLILLVQTNACTSRIQLPLKLERNEMVLEYLSVYTLSYYSYRQPEELPKLAYVTKVDLSVNFQVIENAWHTCTCIVSQKLFPSTFHLDSLLICHFVLFAKLESPILSNTANTAVIMRSLNIHVFFSSFIYFRNILKSIKKCVRNIFTQIIINLII